MKTLLNEKVIANKLVSSNEGGGFGGAYARESVDGSAAAVRHPDGRRPIFLQPFNKTSGGPSPRRPRPLSPLPFLILFNYVN